MKFLMNTGRSITQGKFVEHKYTIGYAEETSSCFINPLDLMDLEMDEGEHILVESKWGSVVLKSRLSDDIPRGMIFVPYGPFANHIIPSSTHSTGMPDFKTITVEVSYTPETRLATWDLMERIGGLRYEDR